MSVRKKGTVNQIQQREDLKYDQKCNNGQNDHPLDIKISLFFQVSHLLSLQV